LKIFILKEKTFVETVKNWSIAKAWEEWLSIKDLSYSEVARMFSVQSQEKISAAQIRNMTITEGWGVRFLRITKQVFPELNLDWLVNGQGRPSLTENEAYRQKVLVKQDEELRHLQQKYERVQKQLGNYHNKYQKLSDEHLTLMRKYVDLLESREAKESGENFFKALQGLSQKIDQQSVQLDILLENSRQAKS
jgi:hypothetical protein